MDVGKISVVCLSDTGLSYIDNILIVWENVTNLGK